MKTISDRIFELLQDKNMSQKEFAKATGIAESSISDWKRKHTNPVADKILIISEVLDVTPEYLLSGAEHVGKRSRKSEWYVVCKNSELGILVEYYQCLDSHMQSKVMGYLEAILDLK